MDFSIDLAHGRFRNDPLDQLANIFTGAAQQIAVRHLAAFDVRGWLTAAYQIASGDPDASVRWDRASRYVDGDDWYHRWVFHTATGERHAGNVVVRRDIFPEGWLTLMLAWLL